ncbi:periplasmic-binding protein/LacI transcriptional regulator [Niallia circulans]|jgi:ribose transport system substrate-binding protein|uniref:sugar ABC transporter substrate-binding protein n=1 Tax=Niallia circulans TaxID=1397 RepID=UPI00077C17D4|nr:sugar ABC transporter substrate-binding protein [Niallia circulans]MDR4316538.1 substrate-binding domain-containing protein [Niallia circulans]MED3838287.1 sugar ABC transporter substrate-binding protein [Niallia circulans]MED4243762.1 sugar ABC transporter substrate-binding protein [Niallia circulans]MED4246154.1 sugar ABC transporter substrate-binding protein [Niallia circulans]NRG30664.1 sugar ABC transporter substrate-binding protein [Niallia circulans]
MKKFGLLLTIIGLVIAMVGCGKSASGSGEDGSVAVVLKTLSSPYWKYVEAGAKAAGKDLGVDVTIVGPASESQIMEQVNMIEDSLNQGIGALVVSPTQPDTVVPVLEQANVPVLFIDTDADFSGKTSFIGTDNLTAGKEGGKLLASFLKKGDEVALLGGALGNTAMDQRIKGAKESLEEAGMVIVAEQPADSDKTKANSVVENILQNNPNIKGIFSANDDMAIGALRATESKGIKLPIIGTDGTAEAIQSIIDGDLAGSIAQNPYEMGYKGVENAVKAMKGEKVESRIDSGIDIITSDNAQEKLDFLEGIAK